MDSRRALCLAGAGRRMLGPYYDRQRNAVLNEERLPEFFARLVPC